MARVAPLLLAAFGVAAAGAWGWPWSQPAPPLTQPAPPLTHSKCALKYKGKDHASILDLHGCYNAADVFAKEQTIKRDEALGVRCDSMVKTEQVAARDAARCWDHCVEHLRSSKLEKWVCPEAPPEAHPAPALIVGQKATILVLLVLTLLAQTGSLDQNRARPVHEIRLVLRVVQVPREPGDLLGRDAVVVEFALAADVDALAAEQAKKRPRHAPRESAEPEL